jgi:hypothetical protein
MRALTDKEDEHEPKVFENSFEDVQLPIQSSTTEQ